MVYEQIIVDEQEKICSITVNRPDKLNALNKLTIAEIGHAVGEAEKNPLIRVIILTGAGSKAFVAGADISEFAAYTVQEARKLSTHGHEVFNRIEHCSKPVIAAVNGFALGGGCELAMACHLRVASVNAKFGQPEVKLGLIPGYGGTQRLPKLIGRTKALELLMTADMITAEEALALGLVNYVTQPEELMNKCMEIAAKIAAVAPLAIAATIRSVNAGDNKKEDGYHEEVAGFGQCFATDDFREGSDAFLNKRKPVFTGR